MITRYVYGIRRFYQISEHVKLYLSFSFSTYFKIPIFLIRHQRIDNLYLLDLPATTKFVTPPRATVDSTFLWNKCFKLM